MKKNTRMPENFSEVMRKLKFLANPEALEGMERFGININKCYGISVPDIRSMAKQIGKNHSLAQKLWQSGIHDARLLASMVDDPKIVSENQMERWVKDFDSWDVCDQCCMNIFDKTPFAWSKAANWARRNEEFVKRAGFALMASLAVHDKESADREFIKFFPIIKREATDGRNYVKKAVNWSLRQIGKRNKNLNKEAIVVAKEILEIDSPPARWIANDALRELTNPNIRKRLKH